MSCQIIQGDCSLTESYLNARRLVVESGFGHEIEWQASRSLADITEGGLLCEAAWVVLCSGMRVSVVRGLFDGITEAFLGWFSAARIIECKERCRREALGVFNHKSKINAIVTICECVNKVGFEKFKEQIKAGGLGFLKTLPFIGPITGYHLAKNIGLSDVAKPDRHLVRMAEAAGFKSVQDFCRTLSEASGDEICVVDIVLWRYAMLNPDYLSLFQARAVTTRKQPLQVRGSPTIKDSLTVQQTPAVKESLTAQPGVPGQLTLRGVACE